MSGLLSVQGYKPVTMEFVVAADQPPRFRFVWDDENPDYDYKSRTLGSDLGPDNPPAVMRFYPEMREKAGDFRVNLEYPYDWEPVITEVNNYDGDGAHRFRYLGGEGLALYNQTGWPMQAYLGMSGNEIEVLERIGDWYKIKTLTQSDVSRVAGWTIATHPREIHRFTCITWDNVNKVTKRINSTGTPRGQVYYPLVTKEGFAYIPVRHVVKIQ